MNEIEQPHAKRTNRAGKKAVPPGNPNNNITIEYLDVHKANLPKRNSQNQKKEHIIQMNTKKRTRVVSSAGGTFRAVSSVAGMFRAVSSVAGMFRAVSSVAGMFRAVSGVGDTFWMVSRVGGTFWAVSRVGGTNSAVGGNYDYGGIFFRRYFKTAVCFWR